VQVQCWLPTIYLQPQNRLPILVFNCGQCRRKWAKDPAGTLKALASYGYKQIEGFEGGKGIFWGMTASEMKKTMDDLG
jgi:hypothetical protein